MAALERISKENIERARQLLLAEIYTEKTDDRHVKRDAIKQLLGPLIAARESGLSFAEISKVFEKAGLMLSHKTLESYYYSLKTEEELAREAKSHAEKVKKIRQAIEAKSLRTHQEHGAKLAYQFSEGEQAKPKLYDALSLSGPASPAVEKNAANAAVSLVEPSAKKSGPATPAVTKKAANAGKKEPRSLTANAADPKLASGPMIDNRDKKANSTIRSVNPSDQSGTSALAEGKTRRQEIGEAKTIDEIERASLATEERTTITADLEVRDDRIFYSSGVPFIGTLTKKQVHLLRTVGRIIALTSGKSSKDFVAMPSKI